MAINHLKEKHMNKPLLLENLPPVKSENLYHLERYIKFINSRPQRELKREKGFNIHHVYPVALATKNNIPEFNEDWNLVKLSTHEHLVAHMILWKCGYDGMAYAFYKLCNCSGNLKNLSLRQSTRLLLNVTEQMKITVKNRTPEKRNEMLKHRHETIANRSPEYQEQLSKEASLRNGGKNNPNYGKVISEETKLKRKETIDNMSQEEIDAWKSKISKSNSGENNGMFGKTLSEEALKKKKIKQEENYKLLGYGPTAGCIMPESHGLRMSEVNKDYFEKHGHGTRYGKKNTPKSNITTLTKVAAHSISIKCLETNKIYMRKKDTDDDFKGILSRSLINKSLDQGITIKGYTFIYI